MLKLKKLKKFNFGEYNLPIIITYRFEYLKNYTIGYAIYACDALC